MSGYLRQLARQAGGKSIPGQPRPLFDAVPGAEPAAESSAEELLGEWRQSHELRRGAPELANPLPVPNLRSDTTAGVEAGARHDAIPTAIGGITPRRHDDSRAATPSGEAIPRLEAIEVLLPQRPDAGPAGTNSRLEMAAAPNSAIDTVPHRAPSERTTAVQDASAMSERPDSQPPQTRPRSRTNEPSQASTANPAPEVHIHIGRVELTALQAPVVKNAVRSAAKKPMSLDDYLRQRDGRRS
jgi:hypothetical protein